MTIFANRSSGIRAAFFCLLLLLSGGTQADSYQTTDAQARARQLFTHPQWRALLHHDGMQPLIKDESFLLSHRSFSLENELQATLALFYSDPAHAICRFPARYLWLNSRRLVPTLSLDTCDNWKEFRARAPMSITSLVFASEALNQPSSMMGHLFLKIEGSNTSGQSVAHAISFFTEPVTWNLPKLFYDSLIGGMAGYFSLAPYQDAVDNYVNKENRNLWEYKLRINLEQRDLLQAHLLELKQIQLTYFFQHYNCATLIKHVLGVVHPEILAVQDTWTSPKDVVRAAHAVDLLDPPTALATPRWTLRLLEQSMRSDDIRQIKQQVHAMLIPKETMKAIASEAFIAQQVSRAYNQHLLLQDEHQPANRLSYDLQLSTVQKDRFADLSVETHHRFNPARSSPDSQWGLEIGSRNKETYLLAEFLPASHRIEDNNAVYFNESSLTLFDVAIRKSLSNDSVKLERAVIYGFESFMPRSRFTGGFSGKFKLGIDQQWDAQLKSQAVFLAEGGIGSTHRWSNDIDAFVMLQGGWGFKNSGFLFVAPSAGLIVREVFDMKSILTLSTLHGTAENRHTLYEIKLLHSKRITPHWSILGTYGQVWNNDRSAVSYGLKLKSHF